MFSILPAQVGLDYFGVPADFQGSALADDLAVVQHHDALADAHDQGHIVLDDQKGNAQGAQFFH